MSRGHVHITDAKNPWAAPDFDAGYLSHPAVRLVSSSIPSRFVPFVLRLFDFDSTPLSSLPLRSDTEFTSMQQDMAPQVWMFKKLREIARRMPSYRGEFAAIHPKYAADSPARCMEWKASTEEVVDLVYSAEDNAVSRFRFFVLFWREADGVGWAGYRAMD